MHTNTQLHPPHQPPFCYRTSCVCFPTRIARLTLGYMRSYVCAYHSHVYSTWLYSYHGAKDLANTLVSILTLPTKLLRTHIYAHYVICRPPSNICVLLNTLKTFSLTQFATLLCTHPPLGASSSSILTSFAPQ